MPKDESLTEIGDSPAEIPSGLFGLGAGDLADRLAERFVAPAPDLSLGALRRLVLWTFASLGIALGVLVVACYVAIDRDSDLVWPIALAAAFLFAGLALTVVLTHRIPRGPRKRP